MTKIFVFALLFIGCAGGAFAQNDLPKSDDLGRISLSPYIPAQETAIPEAARHFLSDKLALLVNSQGLAGGNAGDRFIITAHIVETGKDITPTAPAMTALSLDFNLYIGDGISGTKFASASLCAKGVGTNETKAYIAAIRSININDERLRSFLEAGKKRIIEYYNTRCDFLLKEATTLAAQENYPEAIYKLVSVPEVCKACYTRAMDAVDPLYKKQVSHDGETLLAQARTVWESGQNTEAANAAAALLGQISPKAACYAEVKSLLKQIAVRVREIDHREWSYALNEQKQQLDVIRAARDIGVAYASHQAAQVSYNIIGWW